MIKSTNKRVMITIPLNVYEEIKKIAKANNRTVSNLIYFILIDYLKKEL